MLYKFTIHVYLGSCANTQGSNHTRCYGNPYLIHAPKYKRRSECSYRISLRNGILSRRLAHNKFKAVRCIKVDVGNKDET